MRCSVRVGEDFETASGLELNIETAPCGPTAAETASERARIAKRSTRLGNYVTTLEALRPYLVDADGEFRPNEGVVSQIQPVHIQADLLVEIALLMDYKRRYNAAADLIQQAIDFYDRDESHYAKANAYHWLSFTRLHEHNLQEAERCELKRMELIYRSASQEQHGFGAPKEEDLSYLIATSRTWLGVLALKQVNVAKAKIELHAAQELLLGLENTTIQIKNPRAWGDLHLALGKLYSSEGKFDDALEENERALAFYIQAGHAVLQIRARLHLARLYIKKIAKDAGSGGSQEKAKQQLDLAAETLEKDLSGSDRRAVCLLSLTYSWLYFARRDWKSSERMAQTAIHHAKKFGSALLLAESYRARADAFVQSNNFIDARHDLETAMQYAVSAGRYKTIAAVLLSFARSYRSEVGSDPIQFENYLNRFLALKSKHRFESRFLDDFFARLNRERSALAPESGFYFSCDDLRSGGYDDGLSKFLVWAIHSAQCTAHGDVKEIGKILHFNTLTRAYKYIKLARAVELGEKKAAMKINKTHTIRRLMRINDGTLPLQ
jgi:tetratricopeptide (TPR) repeat protein